MVKVSPCVPADKVELNQNEICSSANNSRQRNWNIFMTRRSESNIDNKIKRLRIQSIELELMKIDEEEHEDYIDETRTRDWYSSLEDDEKETHDDYIKKQHEDRERQRKSLRGELIILKQELSVYDEEQKAWLRKRQRDATGGYDIFISCASMDSLIANELRVELEQAGLVCFMAEKNIEAGSDWSEEIRKALYQSDKIVLLVTPNSLNRPWLLFETGAAWILRKTVIPALMYVEPEQLLDPTSRQQSRILETTNQRKEFVLELSGS